MQSCKFSSDYSAGLTAIFRPNGNCRPRSRRLGATCNLAPPLQRVTVRSAAPQCYMLSWTAVPLQPSRQRSNVSVAAASGGSEPFRPTGTFDEVSESESEPGKEREPRAFLGLSFSDISYYINVAYWSALLLSVLTGSETLARLTHFEHYTTGMFVLCLGFMIYHLARFARDMRQHVRRAADRDRREVLRYAWRSVFWAGFVLWYAAPPVAAVAELAGAPGAIACVFGLGISVAAALHTGMLAFIGEPQVPRRLHTTGVFALLRHPRSLGNMLFLIGFSLAGGAIWASAAFVVAFWLYSQTVVPREERMLAEAFGQKYKRYEERVPRYAWALILLLILEVFLMWKFQPWAQPIEVVPPPT